MGRIYLSPPDVGGAEREALLRAFDSGWIAPLGPEVDGFERELAAWAGTADAAALASGTAALHLALVLHGVGPGDEVVVPSMTFAATANPVTYVGARPVFVDSERETWGLDPDLTAELLAERARVGRLPAAVIAVDLYGQCAQLDRLEDVCAVHGVPLIEDAAEALGATWQGRPAGSYGSVSAFSFNGNKVITTSGGGMLCSDDVALVAHARKLSTQAREPQPHYEHVEIGFNYRLSNLLAALGRAQLAGLGPRIARRRAIKARYREALADVAGVALMPDDPRGEPTAWLTVIEIDPAIVGADREAVRQRLEAVDIETRPAWKPMHLQPVFAQAEMRGGAVAEQIFARGLCLPSGSALTEELQERVIDVLRDALRA